MDKEEIQKASDEMAIPLIEDKISALIDDINTLSTPSTNEHSPRHTVKVLTEIHKTLRIAKKRLRIKTGHLIATGSPQLGIEQHSLTSALFFEQEATPTNNLTDCKTLYEAGDKIRLLEAMGLALNTFDQILLANLQDEYGQKIIFPITRGELSWIAREFHQKLDNYICYQERHLGDAFGITRKHEKVEIKKKLYERNDKGEAVIFRSYDYMQKCIEKRKRAGETNSLSCCADLAAKKFNLGSGKNVKIKYKEVREKIEKATKKNKI